VKVSSSRIWEGKRTQIGGNRLTVLDEKLTQIAGEVHHEY